MKCPLLYIIIYLLCVFPVSLRGQRSSTDVYDDLVLYRQLLEEEQRDSTYYKACREFEQGGGFEALPARYENKTAQELAILSAEFTEAFWVEQDYERAFYIGFQLEEKLPLVIEEQYPDKRRDYFKLGEAYYLFLDNYKSIELLEKALSPVPLSIGDTANLDALKIIGICYANIGEWKKSDEYFRATLLSDNIVLYRPLYNAYALSHLSCNAMLTGHYDKALALSAVAWPTLRQTDDYGHLAGMCYCRGRSHLEKGEFRQASAWVDSLVYFSRKDQYNQTKRIKQAYQLQADYFTAVENAGEAKIYNDSLVGLYKAGEQLYTSQYIARAAQEYNHDKIEAHAAALKTSRIRIAVISVFALLAFAAAVVITSLHRKNKKAYRVLAKKAQQWARGDKIPEAVFQPLPNGEKAVPESLTEEETKIQSALEAEMIQEHAYREESLTAEALAERLGIHRNTLSKVIKKSTGGNFNQYINGLRIKEAILIITQTDNGKVFIDDLYGRVGFSNYNSFYRAFKHFTGLSPAEYRRNIEREKKK